MVYVYNVITLYMSLFTVSVPMFSFGFIMSISVVPKKYEDSLLLVRLVGCDWFLSRVEAKFCLGV